MNTEVSWQVELAVKPGRLDDFRALTREMVEYTKSEEGMLVYEGLSVRMANLFMYMSGIQTPPLP